MTPSSPPPPPSPSGTTSLVRSVETYQFEWARLQIIRKKIKMTPSFGPFELNNLQAKPNFS